MASAVCVLPGTTRRLPAIPQQAGLQAGCPIAAAGPRALHLQAVLICLALSAPPRRWMPRLVPMACLLLRGEVFRGPRRELVRTQEMEVLPRLGDGLYPCRHGPRDNAGQHFSMCPFRVGGGSGSARAVSEPRPALLVLWLHRRIPIAIIQKASVLAARLTHVLLHQWRAVIPLLLALPRVSPRRTLPLAVPAILPPGVGIPAVAPPLGPSLHAHRVVAVGVITSPITT